MSEIKLIYSELRELKSHSESLASKCVDYSDEIESKVISKINALPESPISTNYTASANYYAKQKKSKLGRKNENYKAFAKSVDNLISNALEADRQVGVSVNNSREKFLNEHTNLSGDGWSAFFANLIVEVPGIGWIVEKIQDIGSFGKNLMNSIRRWYEVSGGKKVVDTVLAITGVVLAVVALFTASGIVAMIAAVIGLINATVNLITQFKANSCSDPAWARYYGEQDKLSDVLRKKTFKGEWSGFNKASMWLALGLDVTELVCDVIKISEAIGKIYKRSGLNKLFSSKKEITVRGETKEVYRFDFSKAKQTIASEDGRKNIKKVLKANRKGILFGDELGRDVWKKKKERAIKAYKNGEHGKILKLFEHKGKGFNSTIEILQSLQKGYHYGLEGKDVYSLVMKGYSMGGGSGSISTIEKITKQTSKIQKQAKNFSKLVS